MILLQLVDACKVFGEFVVFDNVTLALQNGERVGLVGANGSGKTSLLNVLAGEWKPDKGSVDRPAGVKVGYLHQSARVSGDRKLYEEMELLFAGHPETEPYDYKIKRALQGVGLAEAHWNQPTRTLSGGEKCRAALARVLLAAPDVLLLDEPTNHLDLAGREWLEGYLNRFEGALVIVAHDRVLLNRVANKTAFLLNRGIRLYPGSYNQSRALWEKDRELQNKAYERQKQEIERTEDFIRRNIAGQKTKQAQSRRRMLGKVERLEKADTERSGPKIGWIHAGRSRAEVVRFEECAIGYGETRLARAKSLVLGRGEKIGVLGPNGCGKSTFLRTLLGELAPLDGRVESASGTQISYFRQETPHDHGELTVREHFWNIVPDWQEGQVRSFLARFLFRQDEVEKVLRGLSGGERRRLELARLAVSPAHVLILDEPTNHLDIPSQEAVEGALQEFPGAILLVSHDRELLDSVCEKLWIFSDGEIKEYLGNYTDYAERLKAAALAAAAPKAKGDSKSGAKKRELSPEAQARKIQQQLDVLEAKIAVVETEIAAIEREGRDPATAVNWVRLNFLATEKRKKDRELHKLMHEWDEASDALGALGVEL
jgi:ATP-binding cassette subfamily F protein 3